MLEEISQNIAKFNIHALVIIGGFEVRGVNQFVSSQTVNTDLSFS